MTAPRADGLGAAGSGAVTVLREGGTEGRGARLVYDLGVDEVKLEGDAEHPVRFVVSGEQVEQKQREVEERRKREARK